MANKKSTKKYFDVAPPSAPLVQPKNRKIIGTPTVGVNVVDEETLAPDITKPTMEEKESITTQPEEKKLETLDDLAKAFEERHKTKNDIEANQPEPEKEELKEPDLNEVGVDPLPPDISEPEGDSNVSEDQEDIESYDKEDETLDDIDYKQEEETDDEDDSPKDDKNEPVDNEAEVDSENDKDNEKDVTAEDEVQDSEQEGSKEEKEVEVPTKESLDTPDTPAPSPERFSITDGLPDPGEKATKEAKESMQNPTIYDTKEYHVPIGRSHHGHGGVKGAFVFGIICALAVVASIVAFMLLTDK